MRWRMAGVAWVVLMLSGCGAVRPVLGDAVMGPDGWLEYCQRHPDDRDCGEVLKRFLDKIPARRR